MLARHPPPLGGGLDEEIEEPGVGFQLVAIGPVRRRQDALQLVEGGVRPVADVAHAGLDGFQPLGGHRIHQGLLRGKVAVDIAMGHGGLPRDGHHRGALDAMLADVFGREIEDAGVGGFGAGGPGHGQVSAGAALTARAAWGSAR